MNRFHVHVHVINLDANIRFYSRLFGAEPSVRETDYAKWMLDDPRLNFAISNQHDGQVPGLSHLGLQADDREGLEAIGARLKAADAVTLAETNTTCCYAHSDKYWSVDPQGLRWESFLTHGAATTYYAPVEGQGVSATGCCAAPAGASSGDDCGSGRCSVPAARQVVAAGARACCG